MTNHSDHNALRVCGRAGDGLVEYVKISPGSATNFLSAILETGSLDKTSRIDVTDNYWMSLDSRLPYIAVIGRLGKMWTAGIYTLGGWNVESIQKGTYLEAFVTARTLMLRRLAQEDIPEKDVAFYDRRTHRPEKPAFDLRIAQ